jgi:hypothetical protein
MLIMNAYEAGLLPALTALAIRTEQDTSRPPDAAAPVVFGEPAEESTVIVETSPQNTDAPEHLSQKHCVALAFGGTPPTTAEIQTAFTAKNIILWQPQLTAVCWR